MNILSLGYAGFAAQDLQAWRHFAHEVMGAQAVDLGDDPSPCALGVRLDDRCQRLLVSQASPDSPDAPGTAGGDGASVILGLELADAAALDAARTQLHALGVTTTAATEAERALRGVAGMAHLRDPSGYRLELFHGLRAGDRPFAPARPMGGFRTAGMGFGHAVLLTEDYERSLAFYRDVLGFRVSDYLMQPYRRVFLHVNARHHSLALVEGKGFGIAHLMVEVNEFDDLGRAYDIVLRDHPQDITSSLGRHSNDHMTSFYVRTPSGFALEYGWGARQVGPGWQPEELFGPSLWGHDRRANPPAARRVGDEQREHALRLGLRAPVQPERPFVAPAPDAPA